MQKLKFFTTRCAIAQLRNWGAMALVSLLSCNVAADYQRLEAIVAVVDDDVVLASELMARLDTVRTSMIENNVQMPPSDVLINQIMERLIIENIQLQEAEKRGVTVDDETLALPRLAAAVPLLEQCMRRDLEDLQLPPQALPQVPMPRSGASLSGRGHKAGHAHASLHDALIARLEYYY